MNARIGGVLGLLLAMAVVPGAVAAPLISANVSVSVDVMGNVTDDDGGVTSPGGVGDCVEAAGDCGPGPSPSSFASANASTQFGTNRASVSVGSLSSDTVSSADASSFWLDEWTFSVSPLSAGSFVTLAFRLDGTWRNGEVGFQFGVFDPTLPDAGSPDGLDPLVEGGQIAGATFSSGTLTGLAFDGISIQPFLASGTSEDGAADWIFELLLQPVDGRTYTLAAFLGVDSSVSDLEDPSLTPFGVTGEVDFDSTAALTNVGLPDGVSFTSAAGASYNITVASVPEPDTWALLLAGLGLIGVAARRRRR
jgi:hypothetical protein